MLRSAAAVFARISASECQGQVEMIAFIAWQIEQEIKAQNQSKSTMTKKMHTSRAALASWTRAIQPDTGHAGECGGDAEEEVKINGVTRLIRRLPSFRTLRQMPAYPNLWA